MTGLGKPTWYVMPRLRAGHPEFVIYILRYVSSLNQCASRISIYNSLMNFSDASDAPDDELVKEVYAYFGLCMYMAQVFEAGLINILTALEAAASSQPTRRNFDRLYVKHEALTFGNLLKGLEKHNFLPMDLLVEARKVKSLRDHLAHRYFREHVLDSMTIGGNHK